jgi:hypothetical protein
MFGLSMRNCTVSSINSHAEAVAFYESCPVKRGHDHGDERPIRGKERSRRMHVRITDNVVKFRYHNTDVVSWCPDDSFKIEVYTSNSTCAFAGCFTPRGTYMTKQGTVLKHDDKFYPLSGGITIHADGRVEQRYAETTFAIMRTDRRKGKAALAATRYSEYRAWYNLMWPMLSGAGNRKRWGCMGRDELIAHLNDEERWHDLILLTEGAPDELRRAIYFDADGVYYQEYADALPVEDGWSRAIDRWKVTYK